MSGNESVIVLLIQNAIYFSILITSPGMICSLVNQKKRFLLSKVI